MNRKLLQFSQNGIPTTFSVVSRPIVGQLCFLRFDLSIIEDVIPPSDCRPNLIFELPFAETVAPYLTDPNSTVMPMIGRELRVSCQLIFIPISVQWCVSPLLFEHIRLLT